MFFRSLTIAAALLMGASGATAAPAIGELVSNTPFTTAYGKSMKFGDLRGEVVVLTYWMSDCKACGAQVKALDYYYRQRRDAGLRVLVIAPEELTNSELRSHFKGKIIHPLATVGDPFEPGGHGGGEGVREALPRDVQLCRSDRRRDRPAPSLNRGVHLLPRRY